MSYRIRFLVRSSQRILSNLQLLLDAFDFSILLLNVGFVILLQILDDLLTALNTFVVFLLLLLESFIHMLWEGFYEFLFM